MAAIVPDLAKEQRIRWGMPIVRSVCPLFELGLDLIPKLLIDNRGMLAFVDMALMAEAADVDRVRQDFVEMPSLHMLPPLVLPLPSILMGN